MNRSLYIYNYKDMTNNECFVCNSHITGTTFRGYDKNLCSSYCRKSLINNYRFNSNFQLEKKQNTCLNELDFSKIYESPQETLIESSIENENNRNSCIYMYTTNYHESILSNIVNIVIQKTKSILI